MAVGLSGTAVVASFASAALGWRLETAFRVVVVEQRVRQAVELACLVLGEPSGPTVARIREDRHTVVLVGGRRARRVSGVGLLLGGPVGLRPVRLDALREQDADLAQQLAHKPRRRPTRPSSRPSLTTSKRPSPPLTRDKRKAYSDC